MRLVGIGWLAAAGCAGAGKDGGSGSDSSGNTTGPGAFDPDVTGTLVHPDGTEEPLVSGLAYTDPFGNVLAVLLPWDGTCAGDDEFSWIGAHAPSEGVFVSLVILANTPVATSEISSYASDGPGSAGMGGIAHMDDPDLTFTDEGPDRAEGTVAFVTEALATDTPIYSGDATFSVPFCN